MGVLTLRKEGVGVTQNSGQVLLRGAVAACFRRVLLQGTVAGCRCRVLLQRAVAVLSKEPQPRSNTQQRPAKSALRCVQYF